MNPTTITRKLAGVFRYPEAKIPMQKMQQGDAFHFQPEPTNEYDPNAIAIYVHGEVTRDAEGTPLAKVPATKCGYIPKEDAARLKGIKILSVRKGAKFDQIVIEHE